MGQLYAVAAELFTAVVAEEMLFRGIALRILKKAGTRERILISSAVFAVFHLFNAFKTGALAPAAFQACYAFAAGIVFALLTERAKSIVPAAAGHLALNAAAVLATGTAPSACAACLYIDPGTGSMLFTVLIGILGAAFYSIRLFAIRFKVKVMGRGKVDANKLPIAIFSDNKRYWSVFEPVVKKLLGKGLPVRYITASEDDPAFSCSLGEGFTAEYAGPGNKVFQRFNNLNATVLLSTTPGLDVYQWKRSAQVSYYVHLPHAASEIVLYRMFGIDYYDSILLSGKYQEEGIRALEKLRNLPAKDLCMVGIPYMDEMAARLEKEGPAPDHPRTVLLAPSWGKGAIFAKYGGNIIDVLLKTGYHVIVRPHPQSFTAEKEMMDRIMAEHPASDQLEWNRDTDNFDVLRRSDILISDFSGVIFDFTLVYGKPVIYTDPDLDLAPYDAWWLSEPLWTYSALPRLGMRLAEENMEDLKSLIDECLSDPRFKKGIEEVKAETWAFFGQGAERAADYIEAKYRELSKEAEQ